MAEGTVSLRQVGMALLAGVLVGGGVALVTWLIGALLVKDDPERVVRSVVLILAFLTGTITAGFRAARLNPARPFATAVLAAIACEAVLLIVARPGLSVRAIVIALLVASAFGVGGALIGKTESKT
jgi:hypothetical protein